MLEGVKLLGLALEVTVGGPVGPETYRPEPDRPLAIFALPGWAPDDPEDERQGHETLQLMESVGSAHADGKWTADEVAGVAMQLHLPGGRVISATVPVAAEALRRLEDDGKLDRKDLLALGRPALSALLQALFR